jgi:hypothetical protein
VVNQQSFTPENIAAGEYFFEPYNTEFYPTLSQQKRFALADPGEAEIVFSQDDLYVILCR